MLDNEQTTGQVSLDMLVRKAVGERAVAGSRHLIKKLLNRKKYDARAGNGLQSGHRGHWPEQVGIREQETVTGRDDEGGPGGGGKQRQREEEGKRPSKREYRK